MAGLSSDYILQSILDQNVTANDNLSAMRELLSSINKGVKNGSGSGDSSGSGSGNNNRRPPPKKDSNAFGKAFKDLFGEAKNIGGTVLGNNGSIQNTVGAVSTSAKTLQSSLGKLPGPIGLAANAFLSIIQVGGMVYDYLNDQLNMYNQLNSAGLSLADGMLTVRKGASGAFLSINEYSKVLEKNSDAIAAMDGQYGDGVEHFGKLLNTVQLTQEKIGLYGVSQQQLADIAAKNFKFEKMYSGQSQLRSMTESQSTEKFVGTMTYLSKTVGKSVDELITKFSDMSQNLDTGLSQDALMTYYGLTEDKASQVTKSMNSIFASMGEAGSQLQKLNASKLQTGALPEEFNNQFTQMYTDRITQLQAAGITDEKQLRRAMSKYVKDHKKQLDDEIRYQNLAGNTTASAWLNQLRNIENTLNDPKNQPSPIIENFTNRFNLWIGKTFTEPFNAFYAKTAEGAVQYLSDLADRSTDSWDFMANLVSDAFTKFDAGMLGPFGALIELPKKLMNIIFGDSWNKVTDAFTNLGGDLVQIPVRIGKLIWEMFTGSSDEVDQAGKELAGSIKRVFASVGNAFDNITKLDINMDDVKNKFLDAFNSLKSKLSSVWSKMKSWWSDADDSPSDKSKPETKKPPTPIANQPKTSGQQKVTSPAEYTKPEQIEQSEPPSMTEVQTAQNSTTDPTNKILSAILNNLESQGQANSQAAIILRQIADNTEPARNV
ncbi:hypothetical protein [Yersinia phage fHe-Yen9-04]|uniref:Uncharacterized protein n=2 Tax=Eneladusvirus Yen904 TaxID=2560849 RepID=A0A2C9CXI3_9CAUD|nr:virion structural protein [Yersinia phage fHe-Yen9-04]SOK58521.1 hypothetical protein [Yersinia phage fHe-Yen9-04]SOK59055.1 hypothetical protein [Yersinia phage fHe-Yen9-03]VUE36290.1 hypothetical protein [Yersinia phage fHe-Yen9-04]